MSGAIINPRRGKRGASGLAGRGITSTQITNGRLVVTYTDGTTADLGQVVGAPGQNSTVAGPAGPAAPRFSKAGLSTVSPNWSTISVPLGGANRFTGVPSVNIAIQSPARITYSYTVTGSAAAGYVCNITFTQFAASLAILGLLTVTIGSAVVFDIQAFEQLP